MAKTTTLEITATVDWASVVTGLQALRDAAIKGTEAIENAIAVLKEASNESGTPNKGAGRPATDPEADRLT